MGNSLANALHQKVVLEVLKRSPIWELIHPISVNQIKTSLPTRFDASENINPNNFHYYKIENVTFRVDVLNRFLACSVRNLEITEGYIEYISIRIPHMSNMVNNLSSIRVAVFGVLLSIKWVDEFTDLSNSMLQSSVMLQSVSDMLTSQWSDRSDIGDASPMTEFGEGEAVLFSAVDAFISKFSINIQNVTINISMPQNQVISLFIPQVVYFDNTNHSSSNKVYSYTMNLKNGFIIQSGDKPITTDIDMKNNFMYANGMISLTVSVDVQKSKINLSVQCDQAHLVLSPSRIEMMLRMYAFIFDKKQHIKRKQQSKIRTEDVKTEERFYMDFNFEAGRIQGILLFKDQQDIDWKSEFGMIEPQNITVPHVVCVFNDIAMRYKSAFDGILHTTTSIDVGQLFIVDELSKVKTSDDTALLPLTPIENALMVHIGAVIVDIKLITLFKESIKLISRIVKLHQSFEEKNPQTIIYQPYRDENDDDPNDNKDLSTIIRKTVSPFVNIELIEIDIRSEESNTVLYASMFGLQSDNNYKFEVTSSSVHLADEDTDIRSEIISLADMSISLREDSVEIGNKNTRASGSLNQYQYHILMGITNEILSILSSKDMEQLSSPSLEETDSSEFSILFNFNELEVLLSGELYSVMLALSSVSGQFQLEGKDSKAIVDIGNCKVSERLDGVENCIINKFSNLLKPFTKQDQAIKVIFLSSPSTTFVDIQTCGLCIDFSMENLKTIEFLTSFFKTEESGREESNSMDPPKAMSITVQNDHTILNFKSPDASIYLYLNHLKMKISQQSDCNCTILASIYPTLSSVTKRNLINIDLETVEGFIGPLITSSDLSKRATDNSSIDFGFSSIMKKSGFFELLSVGCANLLIKTKPGSFELDKVKLSNSTLHFYLSKTTLATLTRIISSLNKPTSYNNSGNYMMVEESVMESMYSIASSQVDDYFIVDSDVESVADDDYEDYKTMTFSKLLPYVIDEDYVDKQSSKKNQFLSNVNSTFELFVTDDVNIYLHLTNSKDTRNEKMSVILSGTSLRYVELTDEDESTKVTNISLKLKDLVVHDRYNLNSVCKFISRKHSTYDIDEDFLSVGLKINKDMEQQTHIELTVQVVPIKLDVHEHTVDFLIDLFSPPEDDSLNTRSTTSVATTASITRDGDSALTIFDRVIINDITVFLNYYPSIKSSLPRVSDASLTITSFKVLRGDEVCGVDNLVALITNHIFKHFTNPTDIFKLLLGLRTIKSIYNIVGGVGDLVFIPIREFRKDGAMIRGVNMGIWNFMKTLSLNTTMFAAGTVDALHMICTKVDNYLTEEEGQMLSSIDNYPQFSETGVAEAALNEVKQGIAVISLPTSSSSAVRVVVSPLRGITSALSIIFNRLVDNITTTEDGSSSSMNSQDHSHP